MSSSDRTWVVGWDVGGAHLKACLMHRGGVVAVEQWLCPLWQGLDHLDRALAQVLQSWPQAQTATHAITMTGEMSDIFADRESGVHAISARLQAALPGTTMRVYGGPQRWLAPEAAGAAWREVASANWQATAQHAAAALGSGVLVDIGSTTTDLIALRDGHAPTRSRTDRDRLASGELVYHGVVRTPLCALARRIPFRGETLNVMNEWFATTADVYRLCGDLDPQHDAYPPADGADKSLPATRRRLARMVGCDARDGSDDDWLAFAQAWRLAQVYEIATQLQRVLQAAVQPPAASVRLPRLIKPSPATPPTLTVVAAGCGAFLVPEILHQLGRDDTPSAPPPPLVRKDYGLDVVRLSPLAQAPDEVRRWSQVCAPSVAVAALFDREHH